MKNIIKLSLLFLAGCNGTTGPLIDKTETIQQVTPTVETPTTIATPSPTTSVIPISIYGSSSGFETDEYKLSTALSPINAQAAYVRGYTGKGSNIAILDTGIDTASDQFKNKIIASQDFSDTTIVDRNGHGTHVAGIAAAIKDNIGVHGVAYDANLIIGKISDNGNVIITNLIAALQFANQNKADVANLSVGWDLSQTYLNATKLTDGVYTTKFTNTNTIPLNNYINPVDFANVSKGEMVIVLAAGNEGKPWPQALATLATLTNIDGSLQFDGRIIIAGNYDSTNNVINKYSNRAAHLCQTLVNGVCTDKYRTYDFYLMAPGTNIVSTFPSSTPGILRKIDPSTGKPSTLVTMTGTSMSAPVISGSVAIIRQMWPQMTGGNIVKLLLLTANKNIPNYNLYVHGQGLLDLDKATNPYGTLGIPTTGRLASSTLLNLNTILSTSGSAGTGGITSVMVVDEFNRDYYIKGKRFTSYRNNEVNLATNLFMYETKNPYLLYNNYIDKASFGANNFDFTMYKNSVDKNISMAEMGLNKKFSNNLNVRFTSGFFTENNTWLGNSINGLQGESKNYSSNTYYTGIELAKDISNFNFYSRINYGQTYTKSNSLTITKVGTVYSNNYTFGLEYKKDKSTFGFMYYRPTKIIKAIADVNLPIGLDQDFNIIKTQKVNLASDTDENRFGLYYNYYEKNKLHTNFYVEHRQNYSGQYGVNDTSFGVKMIKYY